MNCKACGLDTSERSNKLSEDICTLQCAWQYRFKLISEWNDLMASIKRFKEVSKVA